MQRDSSNLMFGIVTDSNMTSDDVKKERKGKEKKNKICVKTEALTRFFPLSNKFFARPCHITIVVSHESYSARYENATNVFQFANISTGISNNGS